MSKVKFGRLRTLVKALKNVPNSQFDMGLTTRCAGGHALKVPELQDARIKAGVSVGVYGDTWSSGLYKLFGISDKQRYTLFSGHSGSKYDKKVDEDTEIDYGEGKRGKKVFKRRVEKFFAKHGKVL